MKDSQGFQLTEPMAVNTGLRNCSACDLLRKDVPFGVRVDIAPHFVVKCPKNSNLEMTMFDFRGLSRFLLHDAMLARYMPSSCVSVCLSVTLWYCIKMAKRRITQLAPHDSATRAVKFCTKGDKRMTIHR